MFAFPSVTGKDPAEALSEAEIATNQFVAAARTGDVNKIKQMWVQGEITVELVDEPETCLTLRGKVRKARAFVVAAEMGHVEALRYLLEVCGAKLLQPVDVEHRPPMFAIRVAMFDAIRNGHVNCVRFLLEHGWTPQLEGALVHQEGIPKGEENKTGAKMTSIEYAAANGQLEILKILLEGEADSTSNKHVGTWKGKGLWAPLLLSPEDSPDNIYQPNISYLTYQSLLLFASMKKRKNEAMTDYLLDDVGISINTPQRGRTTEQRENKLRVAAADNNVNSGDDLELKVPMTPFALAMMSGSDVMLRYLIKRLSSVDWLNFRSLSAPVPGRTVIHEFAYIGSLNESYEVDFLKSFLDQGADPSAQDTEGTTPLHLTFDKHNIELLMSHGACTSAIDKNGNSILHPVPESLGRMRPITVTSKLIEGIQAKIAEGGPAVVNAKDNEGASALLKFAEEVDSVQIYQLLLAAAEKSHPKPSNSRLHPCELDAKNRTVLHYAINAYESNSTASNPNNAHNLVTYLIQSKHCLPSDVDDDGRTALHLSQWRGFQDLVTSGWSPNLKDNEGLTPLHILLRKLEGDLGNSLLLTSIQQRLLMCTGLPDELFQLFPNSSSLLSDGAFEKILVAVARYQESLRLHRTSNLLVPCDPLVTDPSGRTLAHIIVEIGLNLDSASAKVVEEFLTVLAVLQASKFQDTSSSKCFTDTIDEKGRVPRDIAVLAQHASLQIVLENIERFFETCK